MLATAGKMRVSCTLEKQHHALNIVTRYKYTTNKTLYGALTRWGYTNTHITVYSMIHTVLSGKVEYERERLNTLKCGTLQIKFPAFMPISKV